MAAQRYIASFTLLVLVLLLAVGLFNYAVNPYLIFDDNRTEGFNAIKADINDYVRQAKAYHPLNQKIDTLIVGNSRVEMGMDPEHQCLSQATYNLGLPGASVELQMAYTLNLLRQKQSIQHLIIGVDFSDFLHGNASPPKTEFAFAGQERLAYFIDGRENPQFWWSQLKDRYMALLSLDAGSSSVKTLLGQKTTAPTRTGKGLNPAHDMAEATRVEGPQQLFKHTLNMLEQLLSPDQAYQAQPAFDSVQYLALKTLIQHAEKHGIKVSFFINPLHESFFAVAEKNGLTDDYLRWHADIESFMRQQTKPGMAFYDFNRIPTMTDEPVPSAESRKPLAWFWEPTHYNQQLGDYLLARMTEGSCLMTRSKTPSS